MIMSLAEFYTSYNEFRKRHFALLKTLKKYREKNDNIAQLGAEINIHVGKGIRTGCILHDEDDRLDCQSWLDIWVAIMREAGNTDYQNVILEDFNSDIYIEHIASDEISKIDVSTLRHLLRWENNGNLQLGKYNVSFTEGEDIHIGDRIYQGTDAEAIRKVLLEVIESRKFRTLLTHTEYLERMEQVAKSYQATYKGILAGRKSKQEEIKEHLDSDAQVVTLYGAGGLGKTRLLLNLRDLLSSDVSLWYVRNEAESVEAELLTLERETKHVIVIDDAHHCLCLSHLREVLVNPDYANKVVLVLATRSVFKESVGYRLGIRSEITEVEIKPLENTDIDELLQSQPYEIGDVEARYELVRLAEGNPLIAGIAARLYQKGEDLLCLSNQELIARYLKEIIQDLPGVDKRSAENYLQLMAVLGTLDLNDGELTDKIFEVLSINYLDANNLVNHLVESGLVEQYGSLIRLSSEVLADRLLLGLLDSKGSRKNSLWQKLIEPFFGKKAKQILSNLAAAELKGESIEAGLFVGEKLDEFRKGLKHEGNFFRYSLLDLFEEVAYFRPDDMLIVIAEIVDAPELLPETIQSQNWGTYAITHEMVLTKVVEVLERAIYRGGLENAIDYLHKLATYQSDNQIYARVRDSAKSALVKIADFRQHKPFHVQYLFLEKIPVWLEQDFILNLSLCLPIIHVVLQISFHWATTDPTQAFTLVFQQGNLSVNTDLEQIRDHALDILYKAYRKTSEISMRLSIVQELHNASPYIDSRYGIHPDTANCVRDNSIKTATFFLEIASEAEFPILDKIIDWLNHVKRFYGFEDEIFSELRAFLKQHKGLQLYRMLVDGWKWDQENEDLDWQESEILRRNKIDEYITTITLSEVNNVVQELETIAIQSQQAKKNDVLSLCTLLKLLGEKKPDIAQKIIEIIIDRDLHLKEYLGFLLAGLNHDNQELVKIYVRDWLSSNHKFLWKAVSVRYNFTDWNLEDLDQAGNVIRQLIGKADPDIDILLLRNIYHMSEYAPETAIEILKVLSTRSHEVVVQQVAETIALQKHQGRAWLIKFQKQQDFLDIIRNFERLSRLDHDVQMCLEMLGETFPMEVIKFLERRILSKPDRYSHEGYYEAFPFAFSDTFKGVRNHPDFPNVLRYVREWTLKLEENYFLYDAAPRLLSALSLNLEGELHKCFMEWIQSQEVDKIGAIASTLRQFNSDRTFYEICREIIIQAKGNEGILSYVKSAIYTTPGAIIGGFSLFYKKRREEINQWLKDSYLDSNLYVRQFTQTIDRSLIESIEREEAREKLNERNWK
jgi:hypothetical protein